MRSDYGLYIIAIICFFLAFLIFFMGYEPATYITGSEVTDLVIMMFSAILGIVFIGLGYALRPKKVIPSPPIPKPSAPPKPSKAKSKKKPKEKAVKKRRSRKKT